MARHVHRAEVLSIGTELTVGETRDTNAAELAGDLSGEGVVVGRLVGVPDDLETIVDAWRTAMDRADLVVSTGGLGPTPDDLTREAIAAVLGEAPAVDADLEAWLRGLWRRRRLPFPEINLKQAWRIPSSETIPNANGTAPGWLVETGTGVTLVALPGPPREMRPMWREVVLPRLRAGGLGIDQAVITLRTSGIGELQLAALIGEELLAAPNPSVATYARNEAVDIRIRAVARDGSTAAEVLAPALAQIREVAEPFVWGEGGESWADAIGRSLADRGWHLAIDEIGTGGSLAGLLSEVDALRASSTRPDGGDPRPGDLADGARAGAGVEVGVGVVARPTGNDTRVDIAVVTPNERHEETRTAFLGGAQGRHRAGLAAAAVLLARLGASGEDGA